MVWLSWFCEAQPDCQPNEDEHPNCFAQYETEGHPEEDIAKIRTSISHRDTGICSTHGPEQDEVKACSFRLLLTVSVQSM